MISAIGRFFAVLIGFVLVAGGGICTLVGVPSFLSVVFSGAPGAAFGVLFATSIGFGLLCLGLRMMGVKWPRKSALNPADAASVDPAAYMGKRFFINVLTLTPDGKVVNRQQMHGLAVQQDGDTLQIALQGKALGTYWSVPLDSITPAPPGCICTVESTGEKVHAVRFLAVIRCQTPATEPAAG